jgi:type VI secretion system secreted protein VgrG
LSQQALTDSLILGRPAQLLVDDGIDKACVHGVVADVKGFRHKHYFGYQIDLVSPLQQLACQPASRTYLQQTIQQIAEQLLKPYQSYLSFTWQLQHSYPTLDYLAQFQESDWDFLRRQLFDWGISFTFVQQASHLDMVFFDDLTRLNQQEPVNLPYASLGGMQRLQSSVFEFQPQAIVDNKGETTTHYIAMSDAVNLAPGMRITLSRYPQDELNQTYRILAVAYQGQQLVGENLSDLHTDSQLPLQCQLSLIPAAEAFIPTIMPAPRYSYTQLAQVESEHKQAHVDEQGQYKIRLPFAEQAYGKTQASPFVSHVQQLGGLQQGMSHPHLDGTTVAVGYLEGDLNKPIILGALPNTQTGSLVASDNKTHHVVRSQTGHQLTLDDQKSAPSIRLSSSEADNQLHMSSKDESGVVQLQSRGELFLQSQKNLQRDVSQTHSQHISRDFKSKTKKSSTVLTQKGAQQLSAGQKIRAISKQNIQYHSVKQHSTISSQQAIKAQSQQNIVIHNKTNDTNINNQKLQLHSANGTHLQSKSQHAAIQSQQSSLQSKKGGGAIAQGKKLMVSGANINVNAAPTSQISSGAGGGVQDGVGSVAEHQLPDLNRMFGINALPEGEGVDYKGLFGGHTLINNSPQLRNQGKENKQKGATGKSKTQKKFNYYIVTHEGADYKFAMSIGQVFTDALSGYKLANGFESERWTENSGYGSVSLMSKADRVKLGALGLIVSGVQFLNEEMYKATLMEMIQDLNLKIQEKMPQNGGVLVQVNCEAARQEAGVSLIFDGAHVIYSGLDYKSAIKNSMTYPAFVKPTLNKLHKREFIFVWVTKDNAN